MGGSGQAGDDEAGENLNLNLNLDSNFSSILNSNSISGTESHPHRRISRDSDKTQNSTRQKRAQICSPPSATKQTVPDDQTNRTTTGKNRQPPNRPAGSGPASKRARMQQQQGIGDLVLVGKQQEANICAACSRPIKEKFLLSALEKKWHEDCLKCDCCDCRLGEVGDSLFYHSGKILCEIDFYRIFGQTGHCAVCKKKIPSHEMVMKANKNAYHMDCFACQSCQYRFCIGDKFHLNSQHLIFCLTCYQDSKSIAKMLPTTSGATSSCANNNLLLLAEEQIASNLPTGEQLAAETEVAQKSELLEGKVN